MASKPAPNPRTFACPHCEALNHATAERCWLCGESLPHDEIAPPSGEIASPPEEIVLTRIVRPPRQPAHLAPPAPVSGFSLASLFLIMTLACVLLGLISIAPGLGVPLVIVSVVAWARTFNVVSYRAAQGGEVPPREKVALFITSFGNTLILIVMVLVAAAAAFFTACTAIIATGDSRILNDFGPYILLAIAVFSVFLYAIVRMIRANRRRWQRDVGEPDSKRPHEFRDPPQ